MLSVIISGRLREYHHSFSLDLVWFEGGLNLGREKGWKSGEGDSTRLNPN